MRSQAAAAAQLKVQKHLAQLRSWRSTGRAPTSPVRDGDGDGDEKVEIVIGKSWENCDFTGQNDGFYMNLCDFKYDFISFFCIKHVFFLIGRSEDVMGKYWGNHTQTNGAI